MNIDVVEQFDEAWRYRGCVANLRPNTNKFYWNGKYFSVPESFKQEVDRVYGVNFPHLQNSCKQEKPLDNPPRMSITQYPDGKKKITITINID